MANSYATKARPSKPYPQFPLFAHNNGQWCRKINGKIHSFGPWSDPTAALKKHNKLYASIKLGIDPEEDNDAWKVCDVINEFLIVQRERMEQGEITSHTFEPLELIGKMIAEHIPKTRAVESLKPTDFRKLRTAILKRYSPAAARVNIGRVKRFFKFAYDEQLITKPVFYGQGFKSPSKAVIRKARNAKPKKLFSQEQIKLLIADSSPALKAMILLSMNTGMNNADLGGMEFRHVDLKAGWLDYPRQKTHVQRRAPLWPETVQAIRDYLGVRQDPLRQFEDFVFITKARRKWAYSSLPSEFRKLRDLVNAKRDENGEPIRKAGDYVEAKDPPIPHGSFGYFRHTFETVAGGSRDQVAVNAIMGHVDDSMAAEYRESIEDSRLEDVVKHVRKWLFGTRGAK